MYLPKPFEEPREEVARELMRSFPFATLIGVHPGGELEVTHVPLVLANDGPVRLAGHVARSNPFAELIAAGSEVTAIFHGPDAYVSASWYESPREQVPTWNYAVVHVTGKLSPLQDDALVAQLAEMAKTFEHDEREPWNPEMLDESFFANLRRGIVGFEIRTERVRTKVKLSQNRSVTDRARVAAALAASDRPRDREVAAMMSGEGTAAGRRAR
jgi:transcriptional regulator